MTVELIYDKDCPHVAGARKNLMRAFEKLNQRPNWCEWERSARGVPAHVKQYGSPTVLVEGRDIATASTQFGSSGDCCRLYFSIDGSPTGLPETEVIYSALLRSMRPRQTPPTRTWIGRGLASLPAVGIALLPKLTCPLCWPAYAALLSSIGLGYLLSAEHLLLLSSVTLLVSVVVLGISGLKTRRYGPMAVAIIASAAILTGKFELDSRSTTYTGVALLACSFLWNAWPSRTTATSACPHCAPACTGHSEGEREKERND